MLLLAAVLGHGDRGDAEDGELVAGAPAGGHRDVARAHELGHVGHVVEHVDVGLRVVLKQLFHVLLRAADHGGEAVLPVPGVRGDDLQEPVRVVLRVGAAEREEDALDPLLDPDGPVEHERLRGDVVALPCVHLRQVGVAVQRVEHEVGLVDPLAVVLEVDDLRPGDHRSQADHVVDRGGEDVVDEDGVALAAAPVEQVGDAVDGDQVVGGLAEDGAVGLVGVVVDVGLHVELVGHLEGAVDVADAAGVVTVHVDGDPLALQVRRHGAQVVEGVDVDALGGGDLEDAHPLAEAGLGRDAGGLRHHEGAGLGVVGREPLAVHPLPVVRAHAALPVLGPGEPRVVHDGHERVQAVVYRLSDGGVQRRHRERGRGRLHGDHVVPAALGRGRALAEGGVPDYGVERNVVGAELRRPHPDPGAHLLGDDADLVGVSGHHDVGDELGVQRVPYRVVRERPARDDADVLVGDALGPRAGGDDGEYPRFSQNVPP